MSEIHWLEEARQVSELVLRAHRRSAAELMDQARRATGLTDFGPEPLEDSLDRLLAAYRSDGRLNLLGRLATHWDNLRLLRNRLILRERELADPTILTRPVEAPIFILGLPRSGTTTLHRLLALDPDAQALKAWQAVYPYPRHPAAGRGAGPERVQSEFSLFHRLAPELRKVHPIAAKAPQECVDFTAHSFKSPRFDATYDTPSYRRWLRQTNWLDAYRLHRRFLQHLQGETPRRWVLKSPDHVFAMEALRTVYPDARIVFSHRDPLKVLPSVAHLTEVMRKPFVRRTDRLELGRHVVRDWTEGAQAMISADATRAWPESRVFHAHFQALTADPVGTVRALYERFDLEFRDDYADRLAEFVQKTPNGGYGRNVYDPADFGLEPGLLRERFRPYVETFGVAEETRAL